MFAALWLAAATALAGPVDEPPVALAGEAFMAYPGDTVVLDGSGSYDPEGAELSWHWTPIAGPKVQLSKADTATPQFTADASGVVSVELVVDDGAQESEPDVVDVIVVAPDAGTVLSGPSKGCQSLPLSRLPVALAMLAGAAALLRYRRA